MAGLGSGNKGKIAVGVVGVVTVLGLAGGLGHQTGTQMAADERAAATSSSSSAPSTHRSAPMHVATVPSTTTSSTPVAPPPPVPVMTMTCPAGGNVASPIFGEQITATAPYSVVIDYGDGDVYTNDDQHLAAIFSHTYHRAGTFTVNANLTDATGQKTAAATCAYTWTAPVPVVRSGASGSSSGGLSTSSGGSSTSSGTSSGGSGTGDTYTNVDGQQVHSPVQAPSAPPGATAHCNDGTWSFSQHHQGTCSGHGGVATWL